jgi:hypothetical protein
MATGGKRCAAGAVGGEPAETAQTDGDDAKIRKVGSDRGDADAGAKNNLRIAMVQICLLAAVLCDVPDVFGEWMFCRLPEALREQANYGPFAKLVVLLLVARLYPTGRSWGSDVLAQKFVILQSRLQCNALVNDFEHALTARKGNENLDPKYPGQFKKKFDTFVTAWAEVGGKAPSYDHLMERVKRLEALTNLASESSKSLPRGAETDSLLQALAVHMADDESLAAIDKPQTELKEYDAEPVGGSSDPVGGSSHDAPMPELTDVERNSVSLLYDLLWAMIQTKPNRAFNGIIGNAFELMLRAWFTGVLHWRVTYISIRAAKAILRAAHAKPKHRPTGLDRAHAIPTTDAAGEKVKHGPGKHLSRAARRKLVLEPENGIKLSLDALLKLWWENDEVTLVTHGEHVTEGSKVLKENHRCKVPSGLFVASGFGVAYGQREIDFAEDLLRSLGIDWRVDDSDSD